MHSAVLGEPGGVGLGATGVLWSGGMGVLPLLAVSVSIKGFRDPSLSVRLIKGAKRT